MHSYFDYCQEIHELDQLRHYQYIYYRVEIFEIHYCIVKHTFNVMKMHLYCTLDIIYSMK